MLLSSGGGFCTTAQRDDLLMERFCKRERRFEKDVSSPRSNLSASMFVVNGYYRLELYQVNGRRDNLQPSQYQSHERKKRQCAESSDHAL